MQRLRRGAGSGIAATAVKRMEKKWRTELGIILLDYSPSPATAMYQRDENGIVHSILNPRHNKKLSERNITSCSCEKRKAAAAARNRDEF
jgi:hypothetical protein